MRNQKNGSLREASVGYPHRSLCKGLWGTKASKELLRRVGQLLAHGLVAAVLAFPSIQSARGGNVTQVEWQGLMQRIPPHPGVVLNDLAMKLLAAFLVKIQELHSLRQRWQLPEDCLQTMCECLQRVPFAYRLHPTVARLLAYVLWQWLLCIYPEDISAVTAKLVLQEVCVVRQQLVVETNLHCVVSCLRRVRR